MSFLLKEPELMRYEEVLVSSLSYPECLNALQQGLQQPVPWYKPDFLIKRFNYKGVVTDTGFRIDRILTPADAPEGSGEADGMVVNVFGAIDPSSSPLRIRVIIKQPAVSFKWRRLSRLFGILLLPGVFAAWHTGMHSITEFAFGLLMCFCLIFLPHYVPALYPQEQFDREVDITMDFLCGLLQAKKESVLRAEAENNKIEMQ